MRTIKSVPLYALFLVARTSNAVTVNFTAAESYESGPITDNQDWVGSSSGFSVNPSGAGSLHSDDEESNKHVFFQKSLKAGSTSYDVSIIFSFGRVPIYSLSSHRNFISVELNLEPTFLSDRVALILQRFEKNPKLYRLSVVTTFKGRSWRTFSKKISESMLGFSSSSDIKSDSLKLMLRLRRGDDPSSWTASCSIKNRKTGRQFSYKTAKFSTDSTYFSSELYPAIGVYDDKEKSLVFEKVVDSFRSNPVSPTPPTTKRKRNVLFLAVDDLNDWVGLWNGHPNAVTPNIDRLARMGLRFTNAHCSVPACNPSRASLLTGLRPSTTGLYVNQGQWSKSPRLTTAVPLSQRFRNGGYYATSIGKVFHKPKSEFWDEDKGNQAAPRPPKSARPLNGISETFFDWGPLNIPMSKFGDWRSADYVVQQLGRKSHKPFFLACGFNKPHLPWYVPQKYFDRFPFEDIELPIVNKHDLDDIPPMGKKIASKFDIENTIFTETEVAWKAPIQGYLASTAFTDECLGRILDELEKHPEKDNTVIVLWSDHGWHLGEKLHWSKFALWEEATRIPMIFVVPGMTTPNTSTNAPVSLLDIYPTLLDLAGLEEDPNAEGNSLTPLLTDWKYQWPHVAITEHGFKNRAVRTRCWRYILYRDESEELYDHRNDPYEWTNLANDTRYEEKKRRLRKRLPQSYAKPI